MKLSIVGVLMFLVAHWAACSDDDSAGNPDSAVVLDGGLDAADGDLQDVDVGDASVLIPPEDYRMDLFASRHYAVPQDEYIRTGYFINFATAIPDRRCYLSETGSCRLLDCRRDLFDPLDYEGVSAGVVTISGGTAPAMQLPTLDRYIYGTVSTGDGASPLWNVGDTITFQATGDVVPAFHEEMTLLAMPEVLDPAMNGSLVTIDRAIPFVVEWTPTSDVIRTHIEQFSITGGMSNLDGVQIVCDFAGGDGTGSVPTALLELLEPSSTPGYSTILAIGRGHYVDRTIGGFPIRFSTFNYFWPSNRTVE